MLGKWPRVGPFRAEVGLRGMKGVRSRRRHTSGNRADMLQLTAQRRFRVRQECEKLSRDHVRMAQSSERVATAAAHFCFLVSLRAQSVVAHTCRHSIVPVGMDVQGIRARAGVTRNEPV